MLNGGAFSFKGCKIKGNKNKTVAQKTDFLINVAQCQIVTSNLPKLVLDEVAIRLLVLPVSLTIERAKYKCPGEKNHNYSKFCTFKAT